MHVSEIRYPDISDNRVIQGQKFEIRVKERESEKFGKKKLRLIGVWIPNDSYSIVSDKRYSVTEGIVRDETSLPPIEQHISDLLNEAVSEHFDQKSEAEEMKQKTEVAMDAVKETWEKE